MIKEEVLSQPEIVVDQKVKNVLGKIRFNSSFKYSKKVPSLIGDGSAGLTEISRWILNINQIQHIEKRYNPKHAVNKVNQLSGSDGFGNNPVMESTDSLIFSPESFVQYYDDKIPEYRKLIPSNHEKANEVIGLYNLFTQELNTAVWQYVYTELFRDKSSAKSFLKLDASLWQKLGITFRFGSYKKSLSKEWDIDDKDPIVFLVKIQKIIDQVSDLLSDGRKYLGGDGFSAADIAFASVVAPVILPVEYGGSMYKLNEISEELRQQIFTLRATPAGQYVLGLYQDERPINLSLGEMPSEPGFVKKIINRIVIKLTGNQAGLFYFLQKYIPVLRLGILKINAVSRHDLVVEMLNRDNDFTVEEINNKKMSNQKGAFFLGMDRSDPQFDRERNFVMKASKREDLEIIQKYVRSHANSICERSNELEKLDVVQTLNYGVLIGLLGAYFGVPAPIESQMERWQRTMFYDLFLNFSNDKEKHLAAVNSGKERTAWVRGLIKERKAILANGGEIDDNLLNRMIKMSLTEEYAWVDDDTIRRNIGGLLTGIQETTSKAVIFVLQELFKRPNELTGAIAASKAEDMDKVKGYVYEALRFNPVQPGVIRFSETVQYLKGSGKKQYKIKGNRKVFALTSGAMFDPITFPKPKKFIPNRDARYMNWGFGLHECYGKYINSVTIPELTAAVLRLKNVRKAKGSVARGAGLKVGPFPNNYVVEFDKK